MILLAADGFQADSVEEGTWDRDTVGYLKISFVPLRPPRLTTPPRIAFP